MWLANYCTVQYTNCILYIRVKDSDGVVDVLKLKKPFSVNTSLFRQVVLVRFTYTTRPRVHRST
ncbi:hypothetical protein Slin_1682 [Spirosoma linguale DSM 74]|uniref:Uncharacterized protein n=1 Tax=Spirosoma linguale (strain ATCC 33905 / DSM 74 / LMG 10896 / Claus 1) TaxID=504472 RepID=D2QPZ5_SPILD|nr:hypothetical protein Slin_1682 [Spirosoma linguale DSM 74]